MEPATGVRGYWMAESPSKLGPYMLFEEQAIEHSNAQIGGGKCAMCVAH